jgi:hypothetical protein
MSEDFDPETLRVGDRVRHTSGGEPGVIEDMWAYPMVVVRWESTGRTSTENMYYLILD